MTTWNPSDRDPAIVLSGGNLTVGRSAGGSVHADVRATTALTSGKLYWEVAVNTAALSGDTAIGLLNGTAPLNDWLDVGNGSGLYDDGNLYVNSLVVATPGQWANGVVVKFAYDVSAKLLWVKTGTGNWNGSGTADPATGAGGVSLASGAGSTAFYPTVLIANTGDNMTANFGGSSFAGAIPSGFTAIDAPGGNMSGTAAMSFGQAATLSGAGALGGSAPLAFGNIATLRGAAAASGSAPMVFGGIAALKGSAAAIGTVPLAFGATGTLANLPSGSMSGVATMVLGASGTLTPPPAPPASATGGFLRGELTSMRQRDEERLAKVRERHAKSILADKPKRRKAPKPDPVETEGELEDDGSDPPPIVIERAALAREDAPAQSKASRHFAPIIAVDMPETAPADDNEEDLVFVMAVLSEV